MAETRAFGLTVADAPATGNRRLAGGTAGSVGSADRAGGIVPVSDTTFGPTIVPRVTTVGAVAPSSSVVRSRE